MKRITVSIIGAATFMLTMIAILTPEAYACARSPCPMYELRKLKTMNKFLECVRQAVLWQQTIILQYQTVTPRMRLRRAIDICYPKVSNHR